MHFIMARDGNLLLTHSKRIKKELVWENRAPSACHHSKTRQRLRHSGILTGKNTIKQEESSLSAAVMACSVWGEDLGQQMGIPRLCAQAQCQLHGPGQLG